MQAFHESCFTRFLNRGSTQFNNIRFQTITNATFAQEQNYFRGLLLEAFGPRGYV